MRAQLQGDSIPTDMDVWMVISLLSQTGNPVDPEHRGSEIGKHFCSDQASAFQRPALDIGGFFAVALLELELPRLLAPDLPSNCS